MNIIKITRISRNFFWDKFEDKLFLSSTYPYEEDTRLIDKYYNKTIALSFKQGKKRYLVKGKITAEDQFSQDGRRINWYFIPRDKEKLLKLIVP